MTKNKLKNLFEEVRNETNKFSEITADILIENPQRLLIFRLAMKMSQNKFEDFIENKTKNISKYEVGKIKNMQFKTANRIANKIAQSIGSVEWSEIENQFNKSRMESNGWFKASKDKEKLLKARRKGAIKSLEKRRTPQEKVLEENLIKKAVKFNVNFPMKDNLIVDFFLPEKNIIIECKEIQSNSKREIREQIQKMAFQGFKIKFNFPNTKTITLIKSNERLTQRDREELQAFDSIFENLHDLLEEF